MWSGSGCRSHGHGLLDPDAYSDTSACEAGPRDLLRAPAPANGHLLGSGVPVHGTLLTPSGFTGTDTEDRGSPVFLSVFTMTVIHIQVRI